MPETTRPLTPACHVCGAIPPKQHVPGCEVGIQRRRIDELENRVLDLERRVEVSISGGGYPVPAMSRRDYERR